MASQEGTIFKAGAQTHPSLVDPEDAKLVTIPQIVLRSKDENKEVCAIVSNKQDNADEISLAMQNI